MKENKGTFCIAFENNTSSPRRIRRDEQLILILTRGLKITRKELRLISVNTEERLENDRETNIAVYMFEIIDDTSSVKALSCLNILRTQIRDGSSLLFDLNPVYVGINIGSVFGFVYEKPIDEYYILKREGIYFGSRQLLITILNHKNGYVKIIGYDVSTNEEYTLSLDTHDLIELSSHESHRLPEIFENDAELISVIMQSLTIIKKEVQSFLICEQRLYFEDYSKLNRSISERLILDHMNHKNVHDFRNSINAFSDDEDREVERVNSEMIIPNKTKRSFRNDSCVQTEIEDNILFEHYESIIDGSISNCKIGSEMSSSTSKVCSLKNSEIIYSINILKGFHSGRIQVSIDFRMLKEDKRFTVTAMIFSQELKNNFSINNENSIEVYSKCININEENTIIVSVERYIQPKGLYIKIHDFNSRISERIFYKLLNEGKYKECKITEFVPTPNEMRNEMIDLLSNYQLVLNPDELIMIPKVAKKTKDGSTLSVLSDEEKEVNSYSSMRNYFNVDKIFKQKSKGMLIFRDLFFVRYIFNINEDIGNFQQADNAQRNLLAMEQNSIVESGKLERDVNCLISFYRDPEDYDIINVEVFMRDLKISISSQVNSSDIFEKKNSQFFEKVSILSSLMEKMFIYSEGGSYELRIESKALPISEYLKQKQNDEIKDINIKQQILKNKDEAKELSKRRDRLIASLEVNEDWKDDYEKFERYHVIDNYLFKVVAYFIQEPQQETLKVTPGKGLRSQMSNQSEFKRRIGMNASQSNAGTEINTLYVEAESRTLNISYKRVLLFEDLRHYLYGNIQGGAYTDEQVFGIICDNLRIRDNKLILTNDIIKEYGEDITEFSILVQKDKLLEGIQLQGVGGSLLSKNQINQVKQDLEDNEIEKLLLINHEFMFSEHLHDIKIFKYNLSKDKAREEEGCIYILETFDISNPEVIYSCQIDSRRIFGKACRFIIESFSPNSVFTQNQNPDPLMEADKEVDKILEKYMSYSMIVVAYEQSFPQCILFNQELSNFFVMENITFVIFEPNSCLKWQYNLNNIDPYEYFEGNMMRRYIFDCILNGMIGGILRDHKYFQILETYDKIDEITEEISDINKLESNSRLFCLKSSINPDFHIDAVVPHKNSHVYYSYLINMKDFEIRKKRIFYKAYNIGVNDEKELSINTVLNLYLCSNETLRVSLLLNDLHEKNKIPSVNHLINFTKYTIVNGSKLYSELVRFKEFVFVVQIEQTTLESIQNTVFRVSLFCMMINKNVNSEQDSKLTKLCSLCLINETGVYDEDKLEDAQESSLDEINSQVFKGSEVSISNSTIKTTLIPEINKKMKQRNIPLLQYSLEDFKSIFGSLGEEVLSSSLIEDETDLLHDSSEKLLHRKTFFDDSNNHVIIISIYFVEGEFKVIVNEPERGKTHQFEFSLSDTFTRREIAFIDLDDLPSLKKIAINLIEDRILFNKTENDEYKIEILTSEEIEKRAQIENDEAESEEEKHSKVHQQIEEVKETHRQAESVKTITEEVSSHNSDSNHQ